MKTINLNKKFYSKESIEKSIVEFSEKDIKVTEYADYYQISLQGEPKEFANLCLAHMR
jgi:wyosine [tRNA(Phe)-imidazoG37] synthetase (radical SAM superfamily)